MATVTDPEAPVLTLVDMLPCKPCEPGQRFLERYTDPWLALEEADGNHVLWLLHNTDADAYDNVISRCDGGGCRCGESARELMPRNPWWIERFGERPTP